jgi:hypothetical protein
VTTCPCGCPPPPDTWPVNSGDTNREQAEVNLRVTEEILADHR